MPAITINKQLFLSSLKNTYTLSSLTELLFTYGIELEDTITENGTQYYKLDIPANRYDLLCLEGMITAMQCYEANTRAHWPVIHASTHRVIVMNTTERPVVACAVVRNVQFDENVLRSFVNYQDSLNRNIGRNRRSMAIGTHDYDKIRFPVYYRSGEKDRLWITPLNGKCVCSGRSGAMTRDGNVMTRDGGVMTSEKNYNEENNEKNKGENKGEDEEENEDENKEDLTKDENINGGASQGTATFPKITIAALEERLKNDRVFSKYITSCTSTAYFVDSNGVIISYPPVLNSDETKITVNTKNVFIEMTGDDRAKVDDTMRYLIHNFGGERVEEVHIVHEDEKEKGCVMDKKYAGTHVTPVMDRKMFTLTREHVNKELRLNLTREMIKYHLERMMHHVSLEECDMRVTVHPARCDVLYTIDLIEDIAVSYNVNNFDRLNVPFFSIGKELIANVLSDKIRMECAFAGFNEVVSVCLLSREENDVLRRGDEELLMGGYDETEDGGCEDVGDCECSDEVEDVVGEGDEFGGVDKRGPVLKGSKGVDGGSPVLKGPKGIDGGSPVLKGSKGVDGGSPVIKNRPVKAKIEVLDKDSNLLNINLSRLALERENGGCVELLNPKSKEYQVMRSSLLPGLLKFIKKNAYHRPPIRIFEVGDVFNINGESDTGAINCRRIAGAIAGTTDGLSDLIAFINQVLTKCKVNTRFVRKEKSVFLEKRGGRILCDDDVIIGNFGVVHPRILKFYGIGMACSIFEIDLDNLLKIMVSKR